MSTIYLDNFNQRLTTQSPDVFQKLKMESKLNSLCRTMEQYDQAQAQLRLYEDYQRRTRQFLQYNRMKLLELDLILSLQKGKHHSTNTITDVCLHGRSNIRSHSITSTPNPSVGQLNDDIHEAPQEGKQLAFDDCNYGRTNKDYHSQLQLRAASNENIFSTNVSIETQKPREQQQHMIFSDFSVEPTNTHMGIGSPQNYKGRRTTITEESHPDSSGISDHSTSDEEGDMDPKQNYKVRQEMLRKRYSSFNFRDEDVLFERGNFAKYRKGNRVYRDYIRSLQDELTRSTKPFAHTIKKQKLLRAEERNQRRGAIEKVLFYIKNIGGRFLAYDNEGSGKWEEVNDQVARKKIGQFFREKQFFRKKNKERYLRAHDNSEAA